MEGFFAPSVSNILELVSDQLENANKEMKGGKKISVSQPSSHASSFWCVNIPQMVVLVGGYGDSEFLNQSCRHCVRKREV
jgi:hypothetical protein